MPSLLSRPWFARLVVAGALAAVLPAGASAAWTWPWSRPVAPAIPVGPPIYTPNPTPTVVGYQPAPAAAVAPTLLPGPAYAPPATYAPAPYAAPVAVAAPACSHCGTPRTTAGYVPPTYRTNWMQVPTTTYRPVVTADPATGQPINAVVPCTTNAWQAKRVPTSLWGGLWPSTAAPPNTVVYTPATIAAYPPAQYRGYAPSATVIAPRPTVIQAAPVVTQYAPQHAQPYGPPVVTNYAPQPTQSYGPPVVTNYAPAPVATCPHGNCPAGSCPSAKTVAPAATPAPYYSAPSTPAPTTTVPPTTTPLRTSPGTTFPAPVTPSGSQPADVRPRLEGTIRNYTPYDNEPIVPVTPPGRVIETPRIEGLKLQSPQSGSPSSSSKNAPAASPWIPFARPSDKPASTSAPSGLKLLPDPDAEKLDLRKHEIPNLIQPGDRTTERSSAPRSVPVAWPAKEAPRGLELSQPRTRTIPAEIPATPVNDGGWKSLGR